jgi:nitrilase
MNIVRAAVVQDSPVVFDRKATVEKVHSLVDQTAEEGARLVVIPEAFVSAYPSGLDFGARIGSRTPEGREDFRRYYESAVDVPGPACEALGKAARGMPGFSWSSGSSSVTAERFIVQSFSFPQMEDLWENIES